MLEILYKQLNNRIKRNYYSNKTRKSSKNIKSNKIILKLLNLNYSSKQKVYKKKIKY